MTPVVYTPDDYDKNDCLNPPKSLVLILIYMMKYLILVILPQIPLVGRNMSWVSKAIPTDGLLLLCAVPVLLVTIGWFKRNPKVKAADWQRWAWNNGRLLLLLSGLTELLLWGIYIYFGHVSSLSEPLLMMLYINLIIVTYLFFSQQMADAFLEYPEPKKSQDRKKNKTELTKK